MAPVQFVSVSRKGRFQQQPRLCRTAYQFSLDIQNEVKVNISVIASRLYGTVEKETAFCLLENYQIPPLVVGRILA